MDDEEVEQKYTSKRKSTIQIENIPKFKNKISQFMYLVGSNNLVANKTRYQLLTLFPDIYTQSKADLAKILKDKLAILKGRISMFETINTKYSNSVNKMINFLKGI